jgi:phage repressor protein C with HTH and peptisase S24 domain
MTPGEEIGRNVRRIRMQRGLSVAELARRVGVRVYTIQQVEAGKTQKSRHLLAIADVLEADPSELDPSLKRRLPAPPTATARAMLDSRIPVYAATQAGDGIEVMSRDPVDSLDRPASVAHVRDAYAVIVTGDSMIPSVRPGDIVVLHPHKVPRREDLCVFGSEQHGEFKSTIKEFLGSTGEAWRVKRYRPEEKEFTLKRRDWPQCHVVVTIHRP